MWKCLFFLQAYIHVLFTTKSTKDYVKLLYPLQLSLLCRNVQERRYSVSSVEDRHRIQLIRKYLFRMALLDEVSRNPFLRYLKTGFTGETLLPFVLREVLVPESGDFVYRCLVHK